MYDEKIERIRNKYGVSLHYHGDVVRKLFVVSTIIMIGTLPFVNHLLPVSSLVSIIGVVVVGSLAGFISPRRGSVILMDFIISVGGVMIFEFYAIDSYNKDLANGLLFVINQTLAVIFLFALYYSAKTVRAYFLKG